MLHARTETATPSGVPLEESCFHTQAILVAIALLSSTTAGCHWGMVGLLKYGSEAQGPYRAETIANELGPRSVRTLGCLDIGLEVFADETSDLLDVHLGNRCLDSEILDLRKLAIRGTDERGEAERDVAIRDPKNEIVPLHVGAAERGEEHFRLDNSLRSARLCFDLTRIAPDAPEARPERICFERRAPAWVAT